MNDVPTIIVRDHPRDCRIGDAFPASFLGRLPHDVTWAVNVLFRDASGEVCSITAEPAGTLREFYRRVE